jgi:hypothetical protein
MATLIDVGSYIINLDTVTTIELDAPSTTDATMHTQRVVRIHFTAPAIRFSADAFPSTAVVDQTFEVAGAEAELLRKYLAYEAENVAHALEGT